jgi:hypothetical protein
MTAIALKNRIKKKIQKLPKDKLEVVDDFVSYLSDRDNENTATKELLSIAGFEKELKQGEESIKKGEGMNWRKVRHDV